MLARKASVAEQYWLILNNIDFYWQFSRKTPIYSVFHKVLGKSQDLDVYNKSLCSAAEPCEIFNSVNTRHIRWNSPVENLEFSVFLLNIKGQNVVEMTQRFARHGLIPVRHQVLALRIQLKVLGLQKCRFSLLLVFFHRFIDFVLFGELNREKCLEQTFCTIPILIFWVLREPDRLTVARDTRHLLKIITKKTTILGGNCV